LFQDDLPSPPKTSPAKPVSTSALSDDFGFSAVLAGKVVAGQDDSPLFLNTATTTQKKVRNSLYFWFIYLHERTVHSINA
jgi:hypothetical protein